MEEAFDLGYVLLRLRKVVAEGGGELGIGRLLDHLGEGFGDLLLHVESLLEVGDVEGAEVFDVFGKELHWVILLETRSLVGARCAGWFYMDVGESGERSSRGTHGRSAFCWVGCLV